MVKLVFYYVTQIQNQTDKTLGFRADDVLFSIRDLPPGKTGYVKLSRILQCCRRRNSPKWKISVLMDDKFTGLEITALNLLINVRILFKEGGIIEGIQENLKTDFWLRDRYLGSMRNRFWDKRLSVVIATAPTRVASSFSEIEAPCDLKMTPSPPARITSPEREVEAPGDLQMAPLSETVIKRPLASSLRKQYTHGVNLLTERLKDDANVRISSPPDSHTGNGEKVPSPQERSGQGTPVVAHSRVATGNEANVTISSPPENHTGNQEKVPLLQKIFGQGTPRRVVTGNVSNQPSITPNVNYEANGFVWQGRAEERIDQDSRVRMDIFVHAILFLLAYTLVWLGHVLLSSARTM